MGVGSSEPGSGGLNVHGVALKECGGCPDFGDDRATRGLIESSRLLLATRHNDTDGCTSKPRNSDGENFLRGLLCRSLFEVGTERQHGRECES
ncbi:unnamed protein product [Lampetra planeri]